MNNHDFRTICLEINVKMVNPICKITNAPIKVTVTGTDNVTMKSRDNEYHVIGIKFKNF